MNMIIRMYAIDGLKGQQAHSPGQYPGYKKRIAVALKGQKHYSAFLLLPFQGVGHHPATQGDALGYMLIAPSGRYRVIVDIHICSTDGEQICRWFSVRPGR